MIDLSDKTYDYALSPEGFLLSLLYLFVLSGALITIAKKMKLPFSPKSIFTLYLYYYLFFIVATLISAVPNFPDTWLFSDMITSNYFPSEQAMGVKLFYFATYPLRVLALFKLEPFILIQIFLLILSLMILWKSWEIIMHKNGIRPDGSATVFLVLSALYPSFLLFIPIPLREFWSIFGFSILVYGIVRKYYASEALFDKGLGYMAAGSLILLTVRPQLIVIVIIFLALFQKNKWVKYGLILVSFFLIPYLFTTLTSYDFDPSFFRNLRNQLYLHFADAQMTYGYVEWNSYWDILKDIPMLFLQFIFSPFPIIHHTNPLRLFTAFIDMIYVTGIYFFTLYAGLKVSKIYLFIFVISGILFSIWEFHLGGAIRHRMPLVMILLPAASYGIVRFYHELKGK